MLATRADRVPDGADWVHEVKWDGIRLLADVQAGGAQLFNRTGGEVSARYPELTGPAAGLADVGDALLDGEAIVLLDGIPSFAAIADRIHVRDPAVAAQLARARPVTLMVFDVLRLNGADLTGLPWHRRRASLEAMNLSGERLVLPATYLDGAALFEATSVQGLEGVVSKRRDAAYLPGRRSPAWLKVPHRPSLSVVIGGWRWLQGSSTQIGSLLVGEPVGAVGAVGTGPPRLRLAGRVGSGLNDRLAALLLPLLQERHIAHPPFMDPVPREDHIGASWVRPELVIDVFTLGRAGRGRLRQPSIDRFRPDLTPADLTPEPTPRGC